MCYNKEIKRSLLADMQIYRDNDSLEISIFMGDEVDPIVICYWNSDEWIEDPETVVPAMLRAQELFYTDKVTLLLDLGFTLIN